jgi:ribonuclease HI
MIVVVYSDGACRGNPGPMAVGASIQGDRGKELATVSAFIGQGTNNIAEYRAAIEGLKKAQSLGATEIELRMDSELVVRQLNGRYKVKNGALKVLHAEVLELLKACTWSAVAHVRREQNQRADELANLAYDAFTPSKRQIAGRL